MTRADPREDPVASRTSPAADLRQLWRLFADRTVDGLRHKLTRHARRKFPSLSGATEFAEDVVAEAFDSAVSVLSSGDRIRQPAAWLYKTVERIGARRLRDAEILRARGHEIASALSGDQYSPSVLVELDAQRTGQLAEALSHAHRLLPRIGQGQVLAVMKLFLEAIEADVCDYPPSAIAEALGISEAQARTLLHRGLNRLRREAERDGVTLPEGFDPEPHEIYGFPLDSHEEKK